MDCIALARCPHTPPHTATPQPERHENGLHCACALRTHPPAHPDTAARTARKWIALRLRVAHTHPPHPPPPQPERHAHRPHCPCPCRTPPYTAPPAPTPQAPPPRPPPRHHPA